MRKNVDATAPRVRIIKVRARGSGRRSAGSAGRKHNERPGKSKFSAILQPNRQTRFLTILLLELVASVLVNPYLMPLENSIQLNTDENDQGTYALYTAGQVVLPVGIKELRIMGTTVVATTSRRWDTLADSQRAATLDRLAGFAEPVQEVIAFRSTGRPAGFSGPGIVEVYP